MSPTASRGRVDAAVTARTTALAEQLDALRARIDGLDLSYPSIDLAEDTLGAVRAGGKGKDLDKLEHVVAYYLGAVLIEHAVGAKWGKGKGPAADQLAVVSIADAPKATFLPEGPVYRFVDRPLPGLLRDATERYDLRRRRSQLEELVADAPSRFAQLGDDLRGLLKRDPGELDGSLATVAVVEEALRKSASRKDRELRRRLWNNATLYIGTVVARESGRDAEWRLVEDPVDESFGDPQMNGWHAMAAVKAASPISDAGQLQKTMTRVIERMRAR